VSAAYWKRRRLTIKTWSFGRAIFLEARKGVGSSDRQLQSGKHFLQLIPDELIFGQLGFAKKIDMCFQWDGG